MSRYVQSGKKSSNLSTEGGPSTFPASSVLPTLAPKEWMHMDDDPGSCVLDCGVLGQTHFNLSLLDKYKCAVYKVVAMISRLGSHVLYEMPPFLVPWFVWYGVVTEVPSVMLGYRVKCQVVDCKLYILDICSELLQETGSTGILYEVSRWADNHSQTYFVIANDTNFSKRDDPRSGYTPNFAILVGPGFCRSNDRQKTVVIELEVSNRSPKGLRRDYVAYFDQGSMLCVIAIKLFGTNSVPGQRAAAVMWTRRDNGRIVTETALDIGILPLTFTAKRAFAASGAGLLPPVSMRVWKRIQPVPPEVIDIDHSVEVNLLKASEWVRHHAPGDLYPAQVPPVLTIDTNKLLSRLEVRGEVPVTAADIGSLTVNLNAVLHKTFEAAGPFIELELAALSATASK